MLLVEFDAAKDAENIRKHGISLQRAEEFDFATAVFEFDEREDYGEERLNAIGFLGEILYALTYTCRGDAIRASSLRKAVTR